MNSTHVPVHKNNFGVAEWSVIIFIAIIPSIIIIIFETRKLLLLSKQRNQITYELN